MAIQAEERLENVIRALYAHVETNYTTTAKYFRGSNVLDTTQLTEWVEFGWNSATRRFFRQVSTTTLGDLATYLVSAVIYVRPTQTITRIAAIRDIVVNLLRRAVITVVDRIGSSGNLGKLCGKEVVSEAQLGVENDLQTWAVTVSFQYLEEYAA